MVCDRCGESDLSELPQRFRDRAEDLRLHAEKLREQADFWDAQAADPARWRRTHDLLEDPETIAWNLEAGNLRRCRRCEYLGEPLQSDADYFAGVAYIDCPTHGRSEFPSRNDPSPAAAMTPDPFDGHDDPKCPTCGSRLSPFV
jgi:hypothetical protein